MMCRLGNPLPVIIYHSEKSLQLLDCCWTSCVADCLYPVFHGVNPVFVNFVPQELESGFAELTLFAVYHQTVVGQDFEDLFQMFEMFLWGV